MEQYKLSPMPEASTIISERFRVFRGSPNGNFTRFHYIVEAPFFHGSFHHIRGSNRSDGSESLLQRCREIFQGWGCSGLPVRKHFPVGSRNGQRPISTPHSSYLSILVSLGLHSFVLSPADLQTLFPFHVLHILALLVQIAFIRIDLF